MLRFLLIGSTGQIGWELRRTLPPLGKVIAPPREELDLGNSDSIRAAIRETRPQIIVNAAAFAAMNRVETQPDRAMLVNAVAPGVLAEESKRLGALLVHYSSAYVFDGTGVRPYKEDDAPNPINAYGRSKLAGERAIVAAGGDHIIIRLSWIHSLRGTNFLSAILQAAREKREIPVVNDQIGSPTWARTVAAATARVLQAWRPADVRRGIFHLSASGRVSRSGFAEEIIATGQRVSGDTAMWARVKPVASADYPLPAARPKYCVLDNTKVREAFGIEMPGWRSEVTGCVAERFTAT